MPSVGCDMTEVDERHVHYGSLSCKNALTEALTRGDDGEVTVFGHFTELGEFSFWKYF